MKKGTGMIGRTFDVQVEGLDRQGHGQATLDDDLRPLRIPAAAPGDRGRIEIIHESPRRLVGRWLQITAGPSRYPTACPHRPTCGGCVAWEVEPNTLWQAKWSRVKEALGTLGSSLEAGSGPSPRGPWRTRHRVFVDRAGSAPRFVVPMARGAGSLAIDDCQILPEVLRDRLQLLSFQVQAPQLQTVTSVVLTLGTPAVSGLAKVGLGLRAQGPLPSDRPTVGRPGDAVSWLEANAAKRSHFGGLKAPQIYAGPAAVAVRVGPVVLPTPPFAFVQVHPTGRERLLQTVLDAVPSEAGQAIDAGCGTGLFARALGQRGWDVLALDEGPALAPAWLSPVEGVEFRLRSAGAGPWPVDLELAICDPPRSGLDPAWKRRLLEAQPQRIVMVHCGLEAAKRDLHGLAESGYRCHAIHPIDLMPGTMHVELVSVWERPHGEDSGSDRGR